MHSISYPTHRKSKPSLSRKISSYFSFSTRKICFTKQPNSVLHEKSEQLSTLLQNPPIVPTQKHPQNPWNCRNHRSKGRGRIYEILEIANLALTQSLRISLCKHDSKISGLENKHVLSVLQALQQWMMKKNKTNKSVDVLKHFKKKILKHKQMLGSSSSQLPKKTFFFFLNGCFLKRISCIRN